MAQTNDNVLPDFLQIPSAVIQCKGIRPTDCFVYGVIYWYAKMKLQKCTASNRKIASFINCDPGSVSNSVARLSRAGLVKVILGDNHQRVEIIPLVSYKLDHTSNGVPHTSVDVSPIHQVMDPHTSNDVQNKKSKEEKINKNITDVMVTPLKGVGIRNFGHPGINEIIDYLKTALELPKLDGTIGENRQYAHLALKKFGDVEKIKLIIDAVAQNEFWRYKVTSMKPIYYNGIKYISEARGRSKVYDATDL